MGTARQRQLEQSFAWAGLLGHAEQNGPRTMACCHAEQIAAETGVPLREVECFALEHAIVPLRYALNLGSFTPAGQKKLLQSRILVVGLGGLGGYVVEQLCRAGVGRIAAADPDVFEEENLNRQIFCTVAGLGHKKVLEAAQRLQQINPAVEFSGYAVKFQQLDDGVFDGLDLVFDCLDGIADRLALEAKCAAQNLVLIHAAIAGWFGQVGISRPGAGLLRRVYGSQYEGVEKSLGNPPFAPAVVGSLAVALGIKVLLNKTVPQDESLRFIDLLDNQWEDIHFSTG
jgi:molybdopterin-synthase adenylyltransferase